MIFLLELLRMVNIDFLRVRRMWEESVLVYVMFSFFSCLLKCVNIIVNILLMVRFLFR